MDAVLSAIIVEPNSPFAVHTHPFKAHKFGMACSSAHICNVKSNTKVQMSCHLVGKFRHFSKDKGQTAL